jgi:hypothetical protein
MEYLSALAPGTTVGDIRITDATTVATVMIDLRDVVGRSGAASKDAAEAKASMEGSEVAAK